MKIKVISDTHNDHEELEIGSCDVLIHCGDFGTKGNYTEARNFMYWFVKQRAKYKVFIAGNHDSKMKSSKDLQQIAQDLGLIYLQKGSVDIEGYKFTANDYVPRVYNDGTYHATYGQREELWASLHEHDDTTVLITHSPPAHILSRNPAGVDIGCTALLQSVRELEPPYHVFGHIHLHGGKRAITKSTTYINAACKDESYVIARGYQEFDLPDIV